MAEEQGPLTSMLYMEYRIIKQNVTSPIAVPVHAGGIEGFANIAAADLADEVEFTVQGSSGPGSQREKLQLLIQITQLSVQLAQVAAATGQPISLNIQNMLTRIWNESGFPNAAEFVSGTQGIPAGAEAVAPLSGAGNGTASFDLTPVQTA